MGSMSTADYIKMKYLSKEASDDGRKKKKKRREDSYGKPSNIRIIDDDIDWKKIPVPGIEDEVHLDDGSFQFDTMEEKPIVAQIIDDRPVHMKLKDLDTKKWKPVDASASTSASTLKLSLSVPSNAKETIMKGAASSSKKRLTHSDDDLSPPRRNQYRKRTHSGSDSDLSPPRRQSRKDSDSDLSPPRRKMVSSPSEPSSSRASHRKRSPSPSRRKDSTHKPTRRDDGERKSPRRHQHNRDREHGRYRDIERDRDKERGREHGRDRDRDRSHRKSPSPLSRSRFRSPVASGSRDITRHYSRQDHRHETRESRRENEPSSSTSSRIRPSSPPPPPTHRKADVNKQSETESGKKAGLSDAKSLRLEMDKLKQREKELLSQLGDEALGKGAATVFRDRTSGRKRDLNKEAEHQQEVNLKEKEKEAKYDTWTKGLKQKEEQEARVTQDLVEMDKPFARYADDEDRDQLLKEQELEDDPMAEYMRKKKKKQKIKEAKERGEVILEMPLYQGPPAPPNRFAIRPGYRWDGVDRTNGFERKLLAKGADEVANREIAYKWSTEDM